MDPLSALSVTCNILAVVDFTWTLLTEAREIYKSKSGGSAQTVFVEDLTITITGLNDKLSKSSVQTPELEVLVTQSRGLASELLRALDSIKVEGRHSKWKSFAAALREVWGKNEIRDLTDRLESLQRQIMRHILVWTSQQVHDTQGKVFDIAEAIRRIESLLVRYRAEHTQEFKASKDQLLQAVQRCVSLNGQHIADLKAAVLEQGTQPRKESIKAGLSSSQDVLRAAEQFTGAADPKRIYDQFLQAIRFSRISSRYHHIRAAHNQTFDWIFNDSVLSDNLTKIKVTLRKWLETDSRIYWIYGKPGSGKSTLMKYLRNNPKTKQHLQIWSEGREVVIAQFYFWNSGDTLQKSQEGLLRSIIFEMLSQCPDMIPSVCEAVDGFRNFDRDENSWTSDTLLDMFKAIENATQVNFCLFIDGLDEFTDQTRTHDDLLETLGVMCSSPHIKICVSSRPWTVFRDEFGDNAHLKLEDVTRDGIEKYVMDRFNQHSQFQVLMSRDPAYTHLVTQVVDRAQGVFLWVYLVVRTLLEGLTYHDSLSTLQDRLEAFPPDLESFFRVLIDSISPIYHRHMSRYFAIATSAEEPLPAMVYSFLDDVEENAAFAMTLKHKEMESGDFMDRMDQLRRRLDGRSRGLLELESVSHSHVLDDFLKCKVNFLHRTLRDFLFEYQGNHEKLKQRLGDENPALTACYSILAVMKTVPYSEETRMSMSEVESAMRDCIYSIFFFASTYNMISNSETELLNIVVEADDVFRAVADKPGWQGEEAIFLGLASAIDLLPYVERKLKRRNHLSEAERQSVARLDLTEALDIALRFKVKQPPKTAYKQLVYKEHTDAANRVSCRCILLLLQAGADPNGKTWEHSKMSVWQNYVLSLQSISVADRDSVYKVVELLLTHGADWNALLSRTTRAQMVGKNLVKILGQQLTAQLQDQFSGRTLRDGSNRVAPNDSTQVAPDDTIQIVSENTKDNRHRACDICCLM